MACSSDSTETPKANNGGGNEPPIDQGTSSYADNNPLNDVLLQGFGGTALTTQKLDRNHFISF